MKRGTTLLFAIPILILSLALWFRIGSGDSSSRGTTELQAGNAVSGNPAPNSKLVASERAIANLPSVVVGTPLKKAIATDPLQQINDNSVPGRLAYTFTARSELEKENTQCYLVVREIGPQINRRQNNKATDRIVTYPLSVTKGVALDPQFSPDGNYILLKIGLAFTNYDRFRLYVLDTRTAEIKLASPQLLNYRKVWWSPDNEHLAYILGGDAEGFVSKYAPGPPRLIVCSWRTGQEKTIVENSSGIRLGVEWEDSQTLLYSAIPKTSPEKEMGPGSHKKEDARPFKERSSKEKHLPISRPNIYAAPLGTQKPQLLISDGQRPSLSPDKQWIAFFGSENPNQPFALNEDWWLRPGGAALSILNRDKKVRKALNVESGQYPSIAWRPDNRHLINLKQVQYSPHAVAEVKEWSITTGRQRIICTITAKDFKEVPRKITYPQIYSLGVSADDKNLLFVKQEYVGETGGWLDEIDYVQSANLQTGVIQTISITKTPLGLDWFDLSKGKSNTPQGEDGDADQQGEKLLSPAEKIKSIKPSTAKSP